MSALRTATIRGVRRTETAAVAELLADAMADDPLSRWLHPVPESVSAAVCSFETIKGAVDTVIATIQLGVPVARIELLDEVQVDAVNRHSKLS